MRSVRFHWHRLCELWLESRAARHFRAVQQHRDASFRHRDAGNRDIESAREHGATADWLERQREDRA